MAVTSQAKSRTTLKGRAVKLKRKSTVKRRNAPAAALADSRYRSRVVKSAKAYKRKGKARADEDEDTQDER